VTEPPPPGRAGGARQGRVRLERSWTFAPVEEDQTASSCCRKLLAARPGLDLVSHGLRRVDRRWKSDPAVSQDLSAPKPFTPAQSAGGGAGARTARAGGCRGGPIYKKGWPTPRRSPPSAGQHGDWRPLNEGVSRAPSARVPVLLRGESGTGKSVLARTLHEISPRQRHLFAVVNWPALSDSCGPSRMFGHAGGRFHRAVSRARGSRGSGRGGGHAVPRTRSPRCPPRSRPSCCGSLQDSRSQLVGETRTPEAGRANRPPRLTAT